MKKESVEEVVIKKEKKSWKQLVIEWFGTFMFGILILYFFAPASWWQFGVSPVDERSESSGIYFTTFDGNKKWDFADKRGKVIVVNYWASWCPPCRVEMPGFVRISNDYKDRDVEFVGVTVDEDLGLVPPFIERYNIPFDIVLPGEDPMATGDSALPTTYLYDKKGKLAKKYVGMVLESTLRSDIKDVLNEPAE